MASTIPVEATDGDSSSDKGLTIEVLKEHSTRDSMYLLLHDKVYDVTKFMDEVGVSPLDCLWLEPRWGQEGKECQCLEVGDGNVEVVKHFRCDGSMERRVMVR